MNIHIAYCDSGALIFLNKCIMKKLFKTSQEIIDWLNNGFKQDSLQSEN